MTQNLGRNTQAGFVPGVPSVEDMMSKLGIAGGWSGMNANAAGQELETSRESAAVELKRDYSVFLSNPAARRVLEDLLDQTFRRCPYAPIALGKDMTLEQQAAYGLERMGQNGLATYILKMIVDGQALPEPSKTTRKKKGS